jgi:hypothetical protein
MAALALTLRTTIAHLLGVARATSRQILPLNPQLQAIPVVTLLGASIAMAHILPTTENAVTGATALITVGSSR